METVDGGEYLPCGQALVMGAMIGSMFGGIGGLLTTASVALGPNCIDIFGQNE